MVKIVQRAWVPSLVRELKSHTLCGATKEKKKKKKFKTPRVSELD